MMSIVLESIGFFGGFPIILSFIGFKLRGKSHRVGIDYIEIKRCGMIETVLKDKIAQIRWLSKECQPINE